MKATKAERQQDNDNGIKLKIHMVCGEIEEGKNTHSLTCMYAFEWQTMFREAGREGRRTSKEQKAYKQMIAWNIAASSAECESLLRISLDL